MLLPAPNNLAVVPIVVNAGAAVLPAVLAGAASFLALLLKPRELWRLCRRKPRAVLVTLALLAAASGGVVWLASRPAQAAGPRGATTDQIDWAQVAVEILRREQLGAAASQPDSATQPAPRRGPVGFRYDFSRRGHDGGPAPARLQLLWQFPKPGWMFLSSPAVVEGRVYGACCLADIVGNYGALYCLDAQTGRPIWQVEKLDGKELKPFFSSPAITAGRKYVVIGQGLHFDADSDLLCLDADTGKLNWRVHTPMHVESSPAIRGNMVVAGVGAIERTDGKSADPPGFVIAVRISDGKELWRYTVRDPESSPVIADDGTVYIGSGVDGSAVVALRSDKDEVLAEQKLDRLVWRTPTTYPALGPVTLWGEMVLAGGGRGNYAEADPHPAGMVVALDRRDGHVLWQTELPDAVLAPIACDGDVAVCPVRNGEVAALDAKTGAIRWRRAISGKAPVLSGPALAGGMVYAVSSDGQLAILAARDGQVLEKHALNDPASPATLNMSVSSPLIAEGRVYVGSETGGLRCFIGTGGSAGGGGAGDPGEAGARHE